MGADARWVCHDCKVVCSRGGQPMIIRCLSMDFDELNYIKSKMDRLRVLMGELDMIDSTEQEKFNRWNDFMEDLRTWLTKHNGHHVHIGSDYSTDTMNLDDYHNESVDGKVSDCTRHEAMSKDVSEWRQTSINEIKQIITRHGINIELGKLDVVAEELYSRFCMESI